MIHAERIVEVARSWLGVPFLHQGRSRRGVDCAGLVIVVGRAVGGFPPDWDFRNYQRQEHPRQMIRLMDEQLRRRIDGEPERVGDIVVMHPKGSTSWHMGIVAGRTVVHAWSQVGKVIESPLTHEWVYRRRAVYAYPEDA